MTHPAAHDPTGRDGSQRDLRHGQSELTGRATPAGESDPRDEHGDGGDRGQGAESTGGRSPGRSIMGEDIDCHVDA